MKASSPYGILRGWAIGPGAGITAGYLITLAVGPTGTALATP